MKILNSLLSACHSQKIIFMTAKCVKYAHIITTENILQVYIFTVSFISERLLYVVVCPSVVRLSVVCNVRAPYLTFVRPT